MAFFSVWDWNRNAYRVYQTPSPVSVGDDPKSPKPLVTSSIGADPDAQVSVVPSDGRLVGYSHLARGEIRRVSGGLGDDTAPEQRSLWQHPVVTFGAGVFAAFWGAELWDTYVRRRRVHSNKARRRR